MALQKPTDRPPHRQNGAKTVPESASVSQSTPIPVAPMQSSTDARRWPSIVDQRARALAAFSFPDGRSDPGQIRAMMTGSAAMPAFSPPKEGWTQGLHRPRFDSANDPQALCVQGRDEFHGLAHSRSGQKAAPSSSNPIAASLRGEALQGPTSQQLQQPLRKRPRTTPAAFSMGRKMVPDYTQRPAKTKRTSASQPREADKQENIPISDDDDVPSSRANLRSAHRNSSFRKEDTADPDMPKPSIETQNTPDSRIRRRRIADDEGDDDSTRADSFGAASRQHVHENFAAPQYEVPEWLQSTKRALGEADWKLYIQSMENFVDGDIHEAELNRWERTLFQVPNGLRIKIRKGVQDMVATTRSQGEELEASERDTTSRGVDT